MSLPSEIFEQYLADTDPTIDRSKETYSQVLARTKRIKETYIPFFNNLPKLGFPTGGTTDQVLAKHSNADGDFYWETISFPPQGRNVDGGSASSVYLSYQKYDGGTA